MSESHCVSVRAPTLQGLLIVAKEKWRAPRACVVPLREDLSACACVSLGVGAGVTLRQQKSTRARILQSADEKRVILDRQLAS